MAIRILICRSDIKATILFSPEATLHLVPLARDYYIAYDSTDIYEKGVKNLQHFHWSGFLVFFCVKLLCLIIVLSYRVI